MSVLAKTASVVAALIVIGALIAIVLLNTGKTSGGQSNNTKLSASQISDILQKATQDNIAKRYDEAIQLVNDALPKASKQDQARLYLQQVATYENQNNYAAAVRAGQSAVSIEPSFGAMEALGDAAAQAGDKQLAIKEYQACLQLITSGKDHLHTQEQPYLEKQIKTLEAQ